MGKKSNIQFAGTNEDVIWKHPLKKYRKSAKITVPFSHEAIMIKDGQALGSYKDGKKSLLNESKFSFKKVECDIFYITKNIIDTLKWGTTTQMNLIDPLLEIPVKIGAHGEYKLQITNPRKFLIKSGKIQNSLSVQDLSDKFRSKICLTLKNSLANVMLEENLSFYNITTKLKELSKEIESTIKNEFVDYGLDLKDFIISNVVIPEKTQSLLEKAFMSKALEKIDNNTLIKNYESKQEKIKEDLAQKEKEAEEKTVEVIKEKVIICGGCGEELAVNTKFCPNCGEKQGAKPNKTAIESKEEITSYKKPLLEMEETGVFIEE